MAKRPTLRLAMAALLLSGGTASADPLSAIPWLSDVLRAPPTASSDPGSPRTRIEVMALEAPRPYGPGLYDADTAGLPAHLWGKSSALRIRRLLRGIQGQGVPAARELYHRLLLTRLVVPRGSADATGVMLVRTEQLVALGALEEAYEILALSDTSNAEAVRRIFDIGLLTGQDMRACATLLGHPGIEPTEAALIFCHARNNEWRRAVLTLAVAREGGDFDQPLETLIARYLEVEETTPGDSIDTPQPVTPLVYRMLLAIGAGGTGTVESGLPLAFSHLDLASSAPPRARMLAAERLVASTGMSYPILFEAYRAEKPAASGGIWSRSAAVQALDRALEAGAVGETLAALSQAEAILSRHGLQVALAREYAPQLSTLSPTRFHDGTIARLLLLGDRPDAARGWLPARHKDPAAWSAYALIKDSPVPNAGGRLGPAIAAAFRQPVSAAPPPLPFAPLLRDDRKGEALLLALRALDQGTDIDPDDLTAALIVLRHLGLETCARRIAAQTLLAPAR